jgi:hypothetical protein
MVIRGIASPRLDVGSITWVAIDSELQGLSVLGNQELRDRDFRRLSPGAEILATREEQPLHARASRYA